MSEHEGMSIQVRYGVGTGTSESAIVWERPHGWRLDGTDRYWPAMFGEPPEAPGLRWIPFWRPA